MLRRQVISSSPETGPSRSYALRRGIVASLRYRGFCRFFGAANRAGIDSLSRSRNHLERHRVSRNHGEHESVVLVKPSFRKRRLSDISSAQLSAGAHDEIPDVLLRFDPFIKMLVAAQYDVHAVFHHERLENGAELQIRAMPQSR